MARASRHYILGHAWHITHCCQKKEFLSKFAKDRQGWLDWFFEAKKRYGIVILHCMATSNHNHLLIHDRDGGQIIPKNGATGGGPNRPGIQPEERPKRCILGNTPNGGHWATSWATAHYRALALLMPYPDGLCISKMAPGICHEMLGFYCASLIWKCLIEIEQPKTA